MVNMDEVSLCSQLVLATILSAVVTGVIWLLAAWNQREAASRHAVQLQRASPPTNKRAHSCDIGVRCNEWKKPVSLFGPNEGDVKRQLCKEFDLEDMDINSEEWRTATDVVDNVVRLLLSEMSREASGYKLSIDKCVKQGSAREGLKVCEADEFDVLVQFDIEGIKLKAEKELDKCGRVLPKICKLRVHQSGSRLTSYYPMLNDANVFFYYDDRVYLNSRMLHENVFMAIIDKARKTVQARLDACEGLRFRISRTVHHPALTIRVEYKIRKSDMSESRNAYETQSCQSRNCIVIQEASKVKHVAKVLNIDLTPALLLDHEKVPDPSHEGTWVDCPRYALFKWTKDDHPFTASYGICQEKTWWIDCSCHERYVLDMARTRDDQQYILTALRVLKTYFLYEITNKPFNNESPPPIVTIIRSYYLKQIAFYCIMYTTVLNKVHLSGVKDALTILLDFFDICLQEKRLPHFFHSNPLLCNIFPCNDCDSNGIRYDIFCTISSCALIQARLDLRRRVRPMLAEFTSKLTPEVLEIAETFKVFIVDGEYI